MALNRNKGSSINAEVMKNQSGQATTEYILLLSVVVGFYILVAGTIKRFGIAEKIMRPVIGPFAAAYQYGHPLAKGYEDGGPKNHPRIYGGEGNFRIFLNPDTTK